MRQEKDIFNDLALLCASKGYVHAIAMLCLRDQIVGYSGEMKATDLSNMFSMSRLIRTEIATLIGLLVKQKIDYTVPSLAVLQEYMDRTDVLLKEMHDAMSAPMWASIGNTDIDRQITAGEAMREPIFYGGESAYSSQYRDFSTKKYANDDTWLEENKGFSIHTAHIVIRAVAQVQNAKLTAVYHALCKEMQQEIPETWSILPGYTFTAQEVANHSGVEEHIVEQVLTAFALSQKERNDGFEALHDFNMVNATPLLRNEHGEFILFHEYSLTEALYEAPFYWMGADKRYVSTAMKHRGDFTENFSRERLERVFGKDNVYQNVDINESKDKKGEIDVLVVFGDRAIVLQAKSKRLTLEARKGNGGQLQSDFKKSIQDSYDQGLLCAKLLNESGYKFICVESQKEISFRHKCKEIYIFCVVSDHYPALSFQSRQFLRYEQTQIIQPPFVMDVFTLDVITEMLEFPLHFLSYVNRRTNYSDLLAASHELTLLGYHLKYNLWFDNQYDWVQLQDSFAAELDVAIAVRRDGVQGERTPIGILSWWESTSLGRLLDGIKACPDPKIIDFGFWVLTLSGKTIERLNWGIEKIAQEARKDNKNHDFSIGDEDAVGFTVHCNNSPIDIAKARLEWHCATKKYTQKACGWFGLCIHPKDTSLRFGLNLKYAWEPSTEMDVQAQYLHRFPKRKIGRNDLCPCGSGRKYKKCCLESTL